MHLFDVVDTLDVKKNKIKMDKVSNLTSTVFSENKQLGVTKR